MIALGTVYIAGSSGITVKDLLIEKTGGDGICVSWESQDVHIQRVVCDDNYRNGLTITNGRDMLIEDSIFSNTSGTGPSAGCDIEPDWPYTWLKNITFRRCEWAVNRTAPLQLPSGATVQILSASS